MKKFSKRKRVIIFIAMVLILVIIGLIVGVSIIRINIINGSYNSANNNSSSSNLLPEYIKEGITLGGVTGTLIDLDTSDATATAEDIVWGKTAYVNGEKITGTYLTLGMLEIGDYVDYKPDVANDYTVLSINSGYSNNQIISQENLGWRVFGVNSKGMIDLISSTPTTQTIGFSGSLGYNNSVFFLNDIAAKQYSNSNLETTARSLKVEDIEDRLTEEGVEYAHNSFDSAIKYGDTDTAYISGDRYYPNIYPYVNGSGINTTNVKTDGIGQSDSYYTSPTTETYSQAGNGGLTVTQSFILCLINSNYYKNAIFYDLIQMDKSYWLASRYVNSYGRLFDFGLRCVETDYTINGFNLFISNRTTFTIAKHIRPLVSLDSKLRITGGDGTENNPYKISYE